MRFWIGGANFQCDRKVMWEWESIFNIWNDALYQYISRAVETVREWYGVFCGQPSDWIGRWLMRLRAESSASWQSESLPVPYAYLLGVRPWAFRNSPCGRPRRVISPSFLINSGSSFFCFWFISKTRMLVSCYNRVIVSLVRLTWLISSLHFDANFYFCV